MIDRPPRAPCPAARAHRATAPIGDRRGAVGKYNQDEKKWEIMYDVPTPNDNKYFTEAEISNACQDYQLRGGTCASGAQAQAGNSCKKNSGINSDTTRGCCWVLFTCFFLKTKTFGKTKCQEEVLQARVCANKGGNGSNGVAKCVLVKSLHKKIVSCVLERYSEGAPGVPHI